MTNIKFLNIEKQMNFPKIKLSFCYSQDLYNFINEI